MAQLVTVKLVRHDNTPWGFRLQGGKDFGTPLLIQKVNGGSIAERAGLAVGDGLVTVNGYDVFNLKHKEAQDAIVQGGNCLELQVQRGGGSTWKPLVQNVGATPSPLSHLNGTSNGQVKAIVNKQYNTPVGMYSEETIAETLSAQAEVLAGGVIGVNFKKNEKNYDAQKSEVFKMVHEVDAEPKSPEPVPPSSAAYFATSSHAVGGRATSPRPLTPMAQQIAYGSPTNPFVVAKETTELPAATATVADPPNCSECGKIVVGVFVRIKDKNLHVECFKCATCGTSLKNVGYYTINNKLYCDIHAKMIARQNPPAPNLEPITVSPGGRIPSNVVSNAVSSAMSPKSNPVSSPFQTPNANVLSPKSYNGTAAPLTPPISRNFSQPQTDKKESGKIIWPPVETEEKYPTATPGYYPPPTVKVTKTDSKGDDLSNDPSSETDTPSAFKPVKPTFKEQLNSHISLIEHPPQFKFFHPAASKIVTFSEEVNEAADRKESQNITPTEGYPLTRQLSVCSQEVLRALAIPNSTDGLPVKLDAEKAIEVIEDEGRCPSPVPFSPSSEDLQAIQNQANNNLGEGMLKKCANRAPTPIPILDADDSISEMMEEPGNTVQELVEALERHCKTTMLTDAQATALADALTTAPERPYTPLQTSLVPIVPEPPEKTPRKLTSHYGFSKDPEPEQCYDTKSVKELPKPKFETGLMARAMMIAPPIPYHTLKPSMTEPVTIPKPVPLPPPTKPYFPSSDVNKDEDPDSSRVDCNSPLMHALMTAPERCYSPLPSVVEPPSPPSGPLPSLDIDYIVKPPSFEKEEEEEHKSAFVGPLKGKRLVPCVKDLSELRLESKGKESLLFPEQQLGGPQLPHLATELHKPVCIPPYQENLGDTPYRPKTPRNKIRAPEINPPPYNRNTSNSDQNQARQSTYTTDFNKVAKKTVSPSKISFLNASNNENKVPVLGYQPKSISSAPLIKDYDNLVSQLETHITKEAVQKHLSNLHHATFAPITATTKFKPGSLLY